MPTVSLAVVAVALLLASVDATRVRGLTSVPSRGLACACSCTATSCCSNQTEAAALCASASPASSHSTTSTLVIVLPSVLGGLGIVGCFTLAACRYRASRTPAKPPVAAPAPAADATATSSSDGGSVSVTAAAVLDKVVVKADPPQPLSPPPQPQQQVAPVTQVPADPPALTSAGVDSNTVPSINLTSTSNGGNSDAVSGVATTAVICQRTGVTQTSDAEVGASVWARTDSHRFVRPSADTDNEVTGVIGRRGSSRVRQRSSLFRDDSSSDAWQHGDTCVGHAGDRRRRSGSRRRRRQPPGGAPPPLPPEVLHAAQVLADYGRAASVDGPYRVPLHAYTHVGHQDGVPLPSSGALPEGLLPTLLQLPAVGEHDQAIARSAIRQYKRLRARGKRRARTGSPRRRATSTGDCKADS